MPTNYNIGVQVTSTAVALVGMSPTIALTGVAPFIQRHVNGWLVPQPQTVLTGNSSAVVHAVGFTNTAMPGA